MGLGAASHDATAGCVTFCAPPVVGRTIVIVVYRLRARRWPPGLAAVELHDVPREREPDAEAAVLARDAAVGLPEPLKDKLEVFGGVPTPVSSTVMRT